MGLAVHDDDVALDVAGRDAECAARGFGGAPDGLLRALVEVARQVAAVLDEVGRVAVEVFVVAVGEARREAFAADQDRFGRDLRAGQVLFDHDAVRRRLRGGGREHRVQVHLRTQTLHAAAAAAVDRFDHEAEVALLGETAQLIGVGERCEPRHGHAGFGEALLHREFVLREARALDRNSGQAQPLGDGGDRQRHV